MSTEWCMEERCRHRHWRSGSMPTHRRGEDCPPTAREQIEVEVAVDTEELRHWAARHSDAGHQGVAHALFDAAHRYESIDKERAKAWDEGYGAGAQDMSDLRAGELTFQTITTNPYRQEADQ